jgi:hypothetical protein
VISVDGVKRKMGEPMRHATHAQVRNWNRVREERSCSSFTDSSVCWVHLHCSADGPRNSGRTLRKKDMKFIFQVVWNTSCSLPSLAPKFVSNISHASCCCFVEIRSRVSMCQSVNKT